PSRHSIYHTSSPIFPLIHPPLIPTLLPYTTLFRSPFCPRRTRLERHPWQFSATASGSAASTQAPRCWEARSFSNKSATPSSALRDRKSTRLNSSHGSTSYAVFCLKKKKRPRSKEHP